MMSPATVSSDIYHRLNLEGDITHHRNKYIFYYKAQLLLILFIFAPTMLLFYLFFPITLVVVVYSIQLSLLAITVLVAIVGLVFLVAKTNHHADASFLLFSLQNDMLTAVKVDSQQLYN